MKNTSFTKKLLRILLCALAATLSAIILTGCGSKGNIDWSSFEMGEYLPKLDANVKEIYNNDSDELEIAFSDITLSQYKEYVADCKKKGFTVDAESDSSSYEAYNSEGYKLILYWDDDELSLSLEAPIELSAISWPESNVGNLLPVPKSLNGNFSYEYENSFYVTIGDTTKEDYNNYVSECSKCGFNVDYNKGDDYYYADNAEGYSIDLRYLGFNLMTVQINSPYIEDDETETQAPETTPATTPATEAATESAPQSASSGIRTDFKEAMDSYEAFINEYIEFMKKYKASNGIDLSLITQYADYMKKYADAADKFTKWKSNNLSAEELSYYIEVQSRVSQKLLEAAI